MLLQDLLRDIEHKGIHGKQTMVITNVAYDSRKIRRNGLFICIEGFKTDGHLYIGEAVRKGATAVVIDKDREIQINGATVIKVEDTRSAMAVIAKTMYRNPSRHMELIGVTGTNGKTSTTHMIKEILEASGRKSGLVGTISNWIGEEEISTERTTPESLELQQLLANMVKAGVKSCVMEVSSHSLELHRVEGSEFKVGVFTNLSPEHLDFHEDLDAYENAKKKLFYKTSFCNIINIDDAGGRRIAKEISNLKVPLLTYGVQEKADIYAENIHLNMKSVAFDVITPKYKANIQLGIPGMFTVYNAMAAIATSYSIGIGIEVIKKGLHQIKGVAGRLDIVEEFEDFAVIVDYAHTPDALENVLKAVKGFTKNKVITIFGCGGDRDRSKRPVMGEVSGSYSDLSIITSDNPRTEDPDQIIRMVEEGVKKTKGKYAIVENRREAIKYALKKVQKGDIILIAGKGHETYQIIGDQVLDFDDKKVAIEVAKEENLL